MGSPTVFTGSRTKFISSKGALLKDGSVIDNDGVPNFIKNGHAEIDTTGWATYVNTSQATPVNGTGGTANVTWARTTTTPLAGAGSFTFTKDTANRQGQGVSYTFNVDPAFRARVCNIQFDYIFTNINGSFDTSNPNLTVYIYDVTNGTVIQPSSYGFASNSQTIPDTFQASFQTSATGASYRLIFHVATVSTSGYTLKFDNIQVTPTQYAFGTPVTDWVSYTPTIASGAGTIVATLTGNYRRIGDSVQIQIQYSYTSGTGAAADFTVSLPTGLVADTNKSPSGQLYGNGYYYNSTGVGFKGTEVRGATSTSVKFTKDAATWIQGTDADETSTALGAIFTVPILGWSSSVQTSDQTSTRVVAAVYEISSSTSNSSFADATVEIVDYDLKIVDTHNAVTTGASWKFTAPVSGNYRVSANLQWTNKTNYSSSILYLYKNGSQVYWLESDAGTANNTIGGTSTIVSLNAGDYIDVRAWQDDSAGGARTIQTGASRYQIAVERISGPNQIAASETVSAKALNSSGQSIPTGSETTITGWVKKYDTHGMFNTNGVFTIPISGKYRLTGMITYQSSSIPVGTQWDLFGIQSGSSGDYLRIGSVFPIINSSSNTYVSIMGSHEFEARAGDTIAIKTYQSSGGARTLLNSDSFNHIELTRIGV